MKSQLHDSWKLRLNVNWSRCACAACWLCGTYKPTIAFQHTPTNWCTHRLPSVMGQLIDGQGLVDVGDGAAVTVCSMESMCQLKQNRS